MSDLLLRNEPDCAGFAGEGAGVAIRLAEPMARYSLRARDAQVLEDLIGLAVPRAIGATLGDMACLGPDGWLLCASVGTVLPSGSDLPVAITDVSERAVRLLVEGPRAGEVLMAGCPIDLDRFAVGRATRTVFETVEIVVWRLRDDAFAVEVWRSFAPWLRLALVHAAG
ncbi:sarcosine oxidase subunit gamma family protein [Novosphingobium sp.]|uniref:sarcosine oxidase subunit gamma n=1 Tax=Novosphingobium sp. TaxID=1874826 RepID=UPI0025F79FA7|nr:sarcosine oxidase subunit gamma family protein [Novosphingobium sp.]